MGAASRSPPSLGRYTKRETDWHYAPFVVVTSPYGLQGESGGEARGETWLEVSIETGVSVDPAFKIT